MNKEVIIIVHIKFGIFNGLEQPPNINGSIYNFAEQLLYNKS
jgi:hypothetical protein